MLSTVSSDNFKLEYIFYEIINIQYFALYALRWLNNPRNIQRKRGKLRTKYALGLRVEPGAGAHLGRLWPNWPSA
jgi:hypothetical protein